MKPANFKRRSQTHCVDGHAFTVENTGWTTRKPSRGRVGGRQRYCKRCKSEGHKLWRVYKRAA